MDFDYRQPAVLCENLSYQYPDGTPALKEIDLKIMNGEKVGMIGPNGAGKSTFLSLLNGIRRGNGGLHIYGLPVDKRHARAIKALVGLVFQNPDDQLFCPTIFDDVAFGPLNLELDREQAKERVSAALDEVGLSGYEQRSSINLSFGERKLAAIATVLSMQPRILAMDEPTSNLDALHRRKIIRWIQNSTHTCLITSHDLDMLIETCSRIVILNRGRLVTHGPAEKILNDQPLLQANDMELPLCRQTRQPISARGPNNREEN